jgi:hypothetical protein
MRTCKRKTRNCKLFHETSAATGLKLGMVGSTSGNKKENRKEIHHRKKGGRRDRNCERSGEIRNYRL